MEQDVVAMATRAGLRVTSAEPGSGALDHAGGDVAEGSEGGGIYAVIKRLVNA